MNSRFAAFVLFLSFALLLILLLCHQWLLFLLLHLRPILLGVLPAIAFYPVVSSLLKKIPACDDLPLTDRTIYSFFGSFCAASAFAVALLTLHICYANVLILLTLGMVLASWGWWKKRILDCVWSKNPFENYGSRVEWILLGVTASIALAAAVLPPVGYDAHEYHLRAPERYLNAGGWIPFEENVYCAFPMNAELLYLWPIAGQSPAGCTVINLLFAGLAALTVWRLGVRWGFPNRCLMAPLIFLSTGIVQWLILQANIDLVLTASAAVLMLAYERYREECRPLDAVVMTLALGFAFGAKYISALSIAFPFFMVLLLDVRLLHRKRLLIPLGIVFICAFLLFTPWGVRNFILYGNPFYPLLTALFGGTPEIFHSLFQKAHAPHIESIGRSVVDFIVVPFQKSFPESLPKGFSCLWIVGIPALWKQTRNRPAFRALVFMMSAYVAWFFLTQRNDRFLASILPFMALYGALILHSIPHDALSRYFRAVILAVVFIQTFASARMVLRPETVDYLLTPTLEQNYLVERMPHYRAIDWLNREYEKPRNNVGTVLFVGEAQSYGANFDAVVPTVFNHHPLEKGLDRTVTHILYNGSELNRLRNGYGPLGWPLGEFLQKWMDENKDRLKLVFDAYPEKPGLVVVYETIR